MGQTWANQAAQQEAPQGTDRVPSAARAPSPEALAEVFLRACAVGAPCGELAAALAESVLADQGARLAAEVLRGGEHVHARAIELAELVLTRANESTDDEGGQSHG